MFNIKSLATMAAAATLISPVVGVFDANSNANMVVYWGQGPYQKPLSHFCADPHIDIINIAFLNQFPDQTHGYPGSNFGNQCGNATYTNKDGTPSKLLSDCPLIGNDIKTCQQAGKKVLLSLGGAIPSDQTVKDDASAENFAAFLWNAFGPNNEMDPSTPRPFGDAVVDGFDLDIESAVGNGVTTADLSAGYSSLISDLRVYFRLDPSKTYYISGAPQCVVPDAHLADAIETASFDFLFVQFYNTPTCSARSYFDHSYGGAGSNITFDAWVNFVKTHGANKHTKIYLGLPGSTDPNVVTQPEMYLNVTEARGLVAKLQCRYPDAFGGVMIYEATASETNSFGGSPYCDVVKKDMVHNGCSNNKPNPTTSSATSSSFSAGVSGASSASSGLSGLAPPSSSPPYPMSSGSAPSRSIPSGSAFPSGSARSSGFVSSTGSASATSKIGTAPYSYSASVVPSGASTGVSQSALASVQSSVPYPMSNGSSPLSTSGTASAGTASGKVVSLTDVVTITSCAPEVTNCPARTKPVISTEVRVSTILPGSSASQPSGEASAASSTPANSPQSTQEVVTTVITTSYLTTCPVTQTATSGGSQIIKTGSTVSTIFSTITSTICTKCVAPPTNAPTQEGTSSSPAETTPASTQEGVSASPTESTPAATEESMSSSPSETTPAPSQKGISSSPAESPATGSPVPSASTQDVVTTEIVTSYLTTCPVTQTVTQGGSQVVQTRTTTSTVYSTITSTICTKCVAPPTPAPTQAATSTSPGESPATGSPAPSASTQDVVTTEIVTSYLTTCPVTQTLTQGGSQVVQTRTTTSTIYSTITSTICTKCVAPPTPAPTQAAGASSTPGQSPVTGSPAPSASAQEVITTVIEYTTLTTRPVTNTITSGTSEIVQVTNSVSTITRTSTSTITVAAGVPSLGLQGPPNPVPGSPANSGSNSSPAAAPIASVTAQSPPQGSSQPGAPAQQAPANSPASGSSQPAAPAQQVPANSPAQSSSQAAATAQQSSANSPAQGVSQPATPAQQAPANSAAQGVSQPAAPAQQAPATSPSQGVSQPAAAAQQAPENSAGQGGSQPAAPAKASPVQTLTMSIIPIPVNPSQTAKPSSPSESGAQAIGSPSTSSSGSSAPANGASSGSNGAPAQNIPASGASSGSAPLAGGASSGSGSPANAAPANSASSGSGAPANAVPGNSASSGSVPGSGIPGSPAPVPAASGTSPASSSGSGSPSGNARSSPIAFQGAASKMNAGVLGMITFVVAAALVL